MTISKIKRIGSTNRFHVYADENWVGMFLDEIIVQYGIKVGAEFDEKNFQEIRELNDEKVAFDLAVSYLEKYVVSTKGLKDHLRKKGFSGKVIAKTLEKLSEYELLDDEKFANNYFSSMSSTHGKRAVAAKLRQKGVSGEIIENVLEQVNEEDEIENARRLAEKFVQNREKSTKNKQKCLAHLIYKGYDYGVAQKVTNEIFSFTGEENDWI